MQVLKVEFKEPEDKVRLADLPAGAVFRYHSDVCMKTTEVVTANKVIRCVGRAGVVGTIRDLAAVTEVEPLDATLTIFEREVQ